MGKHRALSRLGPRLAAPVALFAVSACMLVFSLSASADTCDPTTDPTCQPAPTATDTTTTDPAPTTAATTTTTTAVVTTTTTTAAVTTTTTTTAATGGGGSTGGGSTGGGSSGGGSSGGGASTSKAVPTSARPTASASAAASASHGSTAAANQKGGVEALAVTGGPRMPSAMMAASTAGIVIAFVVAIMFLVRERRLQRQEAEDAEADYWADYR
jgi:hypothetical protein